MMESNTHHLKHATRAADLRRLVGAVAAMTAVVTIVASAATAGDPLPLGATNADYFQPGTQPMPLDFDPLLQSAHCSFCHANYDQPTVEPYATWKASMLAQSARDPLFWAGVSIANQDVDGAGQLCIRCHIPMGFLRGHDLPADGSAIDADDRDGVSCVICHRMVNPEFDVAVSPTQDQSIIADLEGAGLLPPQGSNARFVIDPTDVRRGPYDDVPFNVHVGEPQPELIHSPLHQDSALCWTCHDVSNPLTMLTKDGSFVYSADDAPHPTAEQSDMLPLHRTFSEWQNSYYATLGGIDHGGRFGGNHPTGIMETCQDCHMPDQQGRGSNLPDPPFLARPDIGQHTFIGANTWVLSAIRNLEDDFTTGLSEDSVNAAVARNTAMLEAASDLELTQSGAVMTARVINESGHKLPTGFPDGRRIWVNVQFLDANEDLMIEHGAYDFGTGTLLDGGNDTTVFEAVLGLDDYAADITGKPAGQTFHFVLANEIMKDNRIPPRGFLNSVAIENGSQSVGTFYTNGQHWHDSDYPVPAGATQALVTVYYQLTSREFIEFMRDANTTDSTGQIAYDQWVACGMSAPVVMDTAVLNLMVPGDIDGDCLIGFSDLLLLLTYWGDCLPEPFECPFDLNGDGTSGFADLLILLTNYGSTCDP